VRVPGDSWVPAADFDEVLGSCEKGREEEERERERVAILKGFSSLTF
jgi:hypothetical protein